MKPRRQDAVSILLVVRESGRRRAILRALDGPNRAVLAVNSLGEALSRLHLGHFDLVVCVDRFADADMHEDFELLIEPTPLRSVGRFGESLHLAGPGIGAFAVLLVASESPSDVATAVNESLARLREPRRPHGVY